VAGVRLKRNLKTGAALAFIAALIVLFVHPSYRNGSRSLHGQTAKNFDLTIDGKPAQLSDLHGKVVLLNFWASWCQPCVDEAASLDALQKKIAPLGGTVLGVSVDDDATAYDRFLRTYNVDFPTYQDPSKQIPLSYGTTMYPETYVIDRDGKIDSKIIGPQDWTSPAMMAYLDSVLRVK
jgi:cytochrome c biogenesis protein CcmG, thiol:disulfide interchange protein DsbE